MGVVAPAMQRQASVQGGYANRSVSDWMVPFFWLQQLVYMGWLGCKSKGSVSR